MNSLVASFVIVVGLLTPPLPPPPQQCTEALVVTTPCEGVLLPSSAAAEAIHALEIVIPELKLKMQFQEDTCNLKLESYEEILKIERADSDMKDFMLNKALEIGENGFDTSIEEKWWKHPVIWYAGGILTAVGIVYVVELGRSNP